MHSFHQSVKYCLTITLHFNTSVDFYLTYLTNSGAPAPLARASGASIPKQNY